MEKPSAVAGVYVSEGHLWVTTNIGHEMEPGYFIAVRGIVPQMRFWTAFINDTSLFGKQADRSSWESLSEDVQSRIVEKLGAIGLWSAK